MLFIFAFCFSVEASLANYDRQLDFTSAEYYLYLTEKEIIIRNTPSTENGDNIIYSSNNVIDGTITLNLGVNLDPNSQNIFRIIQSACASFKLNINIENLDQSTNNLDITFSGEQACANNIDITFHIEQPFIHFSNTLANANLKVLMLNDDQLIASFPSSSREKFVICYTNSDCSKQDGFSTQSDEVYLSFIDDTLLGEVVSGLFQSNNIQYLRFLYPTQDKISFPKLPMSNIHQLELIGLSSSNPVEISLADGIETQFIDKWVIQNVKFSTESSASEFHLQEVFVKDTVNVFPDQGTFHIRKTREYRRSDSTTSPFQNVQSIYESTFEIFPDFETYGDITITGKANEILVDGSSNEHITTIPILNNPIIFIQNQQNSKNNTIKIIAESDAKSFSIRIENCNPIPIELINLVDTSFNIDFYTNQETDISITLLNAQSAIYHHFNLDKSRLFNEFPIKETKFVFCLSSEKCEKPEFFAFNVLQIPIPGPNSATVIENFYKKVDNLGQTTFDHIVIYVKKENNETELDLMSHFQSIVGQFRIINDEKEPELIVVKLSSLPSQNIFWEINKCHIIYTGQEQEYLINELLCIDGGKIKENNLIKINKKRYIENIDLTLNDQYVTISENSFEFGNVTTIAKPTENVRFIVKCDQSNLKKIIFQHKDLAKSTCDISIDFQAFDSKSQNIPVLFSEKWHQLSIDSIGKIRINVENNVHIVFLSIPDKVHVDVYNKEEIPKLLSQTPVKNNQDKIAICFNSEECSKLNGFLLDNDEFYFTTKNSDEFLTLMEIISNNPYKYYKTMKIFIVEGDNEIQFQNIPYEKVEKVLLIGCLDKNNANVLLTDQTVTENIKSWYIKDIHFYRTNSATDKNFFFNEIIVSNTYLVFPDNLFSFNTALCEIKSPYNPNVFDSLKNKMTNMIYELTPSFDNGDYTIIYDAENIYPYGIVSEDQVISNPPVENFTFLIHANDHLNENKLIIRRTSTQTYNNLNLIIVDLLNALTVSFECDAASSALDFNVQISAENVSMIKVEKHESCDETATKVTVKEIENTNPLPTISRSHSPTPSQSPPPPETPTEIFSQSSFFSSSDSFTESESFTLAATETLSQSPQRTPIETPSQSPSFSPQETPLESPTASPSRTPIVDNLTDFPVVDIVSDSFNFEMAEEGFFEDDNENLTAVNMSNEVVNTITFTQKKITITETAEFQSFSPLYFIANKTGSTIILTENVTHSNIGVSSDNSPTVVLSKSEHPLSFVNSNDHGYVQIDLDNSPSFVNHSLNLNHVNNKVGFFTLTVPESIQTVSFASIVMSKLSSFFISSRSSTRQIREDENDENDEVTVEVRNLLNVTSLSEATFMSKINLNGDVSLFDDSTLIFRQPVTFSSQNSVLKIVFRTNNQSRENPILIFDKELDSAPSSIILSNDLDGELIDVSELEFIEAKDFKSCEIWRQKIGFENGRQGSIESRCELVENETTGDANVTVLAMSVKETHKKKSDGKLSVGAIVGIVIGCVAAVVLIVLLAVFLSRRGQSTDITTDISVIEEDSIGL